MSHYVSRAEQMIDRRARKKASLIFKRRIAGQITRDDFEEGEPKTAAPAIGAI
jgi:hypothetical protein